MRTRQLFAAVAVFCWIGFAATTAVAQDPLDEVRRLAEAGESAQALTELTAVVAENPDRVEALFLHGVLLFEDGRVGPARKAFESLISSHPDFPEAYNNLAVIQAAEGDYDGATATLKRGLKTDASYRAAYENLTRIFAQLASEAYGRALEIESPERRPVDLVFLRALSTPPAVSPLVAAPPIEETQMVAVDSEPVPEEQESVTPSDLEPETVPEQKPAEVAEMADNPEGEAVSPTDEAPRVSDEIDGTSGDVARRVAAWARSWSEQRADDYLGFYAEDFSPGDGVSHDEWAGLRRERISGPDYIRVDVAILDSTVVGEDRATVTFMQAYESDRFSDQVTKTLEFERREQEWKIVRETAEP
ncbi:MAG: tetratricopeptide repeat protein [Acidobacteriota bacterium]|nr:tetratricopeptide repeat protein [Acidobacteriota bacterium]